MIRSIFVCVAAVVALTDVAPAYCVDSFKVRQLYSNQDGNWQFVELEEISGSDGQDQFQGLTLSVTNRYGVTKTFTFPANLPTAKTAGAHVTIVSQELARVANYFPPFVPDFVMPNQFLPTDGGTIDFDGIDRWTFEGLPIDRSGLVRNGDSASATDGLPLMQNFAGRQVHPPGGFTTVYEYYYPETDDYFMSGSQPDIDALDTGRIAGWQRTGKLFYAPTADGTLRDGNVCRYYIPPTSHFFSASADECDAVARLYPQDVLETLAAFGAWLPDPVTGVCPSSGYHDLFEVDIDLWPVFRLWNGGNDAKRRYTTDWNIREQMIQQGWKPEGYGPYGVAMCVLNTLDF